MNEISNSLISCQFSTIQGHLRTINNENKTAGRIETSKYEQINMHCGIAEN